MDQRIYGPAIFGFLDLIWSTTGPVCISAEAQAGEAESILKKLSGSKGICAVLGDRKAELTLQLARKSEFVFYIQLRNGADVPAAREGADAAGSMGAVSTWSRAIPHSANSLTSSLPMKSRRK